MKKGSKPKKKNSPSAAAEKVPAEWLFISRREIGVRAVKNALDGMPGLDIEIWEQAGVLEVTLKDGTTVDFEETACDLGDEYSNHFLEEHGAQTLFYVTIVPSGYELARPVMETAAGKLEGLFCGDTDDFTPEIS